MPRYASAALLLVLTAIPAHASAQSAEGKDLLWVTYDGGEGPGKGKHIVLVSGDEEYRSEEGLPQLAKILAKRHGFKCTVLFAIDPKDGTINPNFSSNIPGLEALDSADLMIIATRFRNLPDEQMKHVVDYLDAGKPVLGMRTATHAFSIPAGRKYAKYSWETGTKGYEQGFGRQVLGETWISHHGDHGRQSTRGILVKSETNNPILRGIKDGDIWGPTDVYGVRLPLPGDSQPLVLGEVVSGMKSTDQAAPGKKNDPMMPVAWVRTYDAGEGKRGKAFCTTMGAATDLESAGMRRLLVNAVYWLEGLTVPDGGTNVELVGDYRPTRFGFGGYRRGVRPADLQKW